MAVTVKRSKYAGTWFTAAEYAAVVAAARQRDMSLCRYLREAAVGAAGSEVTVRVPRAAAEALVERHAGAGAS